MLLFNKLKTLLELNLVSFQPGASIAIKDALCLFEFYLKSTVINHNRNDFVETSGSSIESPLAPALAECYINALDISVSKIV